MADRLEPQVSTGANTPLSALIENALRQWGSGSPSAVDGSTTHMLLGFANQVIQDINGHPYHRGGPIPFYVHPSDRRPVADIIIVAGILHYYALQQASGRTQIYAPAYYRTLNGVLWQELNSNTAIRVRPFDDRAGTSDINGMPEVE